MRMASRCQDIRLSKRRSLMGEADALGLVATSPRNSNAGPPCLRRKQPFVEEYPRVCAWIFELSGYRLGRSRSLMEAADALGGVATRHQTPKDRSHDRHNTMVTRS